MGVVAVVTGMIGWLDESGSEGEVEVFALWRAPVL